MTWVEVGEIIKAVSPAITATTALAAVIIGWRGLNKWQAEMIGRRRSEIAEDVLAAFDEARDRLRSIRLHGGLFDENEGRRAPEDETPLQKRDRDAAFVPFARYQRHRDFLGSVLAKRYRLRALLGSGANVEQPFRELENCLAEVLFAVDRLMQTAGQQPAERSQWEATIRSHDEADAISKKMDAAIASLERLCRPILEGKPQPKRWWWRA